MLNPKLIKILQVITNAVCHGSRLKNSSKNKNKEEEEAKKANECKFRPEINELSRSINDYNNPNSQNSSFYDRNKEWKEKIEAQKEKLKQEKLDKELEEMVPEIKPKLSENSNKNLISRTINTRTRRLNMSVVNTEPCLDSKKL